MRKIILCILFLFCFLVAAAQTGETLPIQFIQFFKTYNLLNPASIGRDSTVELNVGNKMLGGDFSGVQTFYANANFNIKASKGRKHTIGLTFMNDKEGSYINKSRASLLYAFHIPLSRSVILSAGIGLGFINYTFKPSNVTEGASAFAPNADAGIWLRSPNFNLGFSTNQIIPSQIRPIDQVYYVTRYYNIIADKKFNPGYNLSLSPTAIFSWMDADTYNAEMALLACYHQNFLVGVGYKYNRGPSVSAGLENLRLGHQRLKMTLSYFTPGGGMAFYNPPAYELSLSYIPSFGKHGATDESEPQEE